MSGDKRGRGSVAVVARSFVVRALLEDDTRRWHGFVTDAQTGARRVWRRPSDVSRFIERRLADEDARVAAADPAQPDRIGQLQLGGLALAGPPLTDVVTDMLNVLGEHLPDPVPAVPLPNVTLERVAEKLVGLGNHRGSEPTGQLGVRTLRGGRLDARVRFQIWATSPPAVDDAMQTVHSSLLDDLDQLHAAGFLKLAAAGTTLAEHVETIPAWRKASSFDVLYEYQYTDADDADSLIARIPLTTDSDDAGGLGHEQDVVSDEMVRWDDEAAPALVVRGPAAISTIAALAYVPGPPLGGTVTFGRTSGTGAPAAPFADLDALLVAISGPSPAEADAELSLAPGDALAALGPTESGPSLGDWDTDGIDDSYTSTQRRLDQPIVLASAAEHFEVQYHPPPGPATGLDQTAVVYLRVGPP